MAASSSSSPLTTFLTFFTKPKTKPNPLPTISITSKTNENNNSSLSYSYKTTTPVVDDITSVVCPSLAYSNTLFFRTGYNVQVIVDENEHEEKLIGRFRREVMRAGIIQECKRRRYHENKQDEDKRKTREAAKRNRRRRTPFRPLGDKPEDTKSKKEEDDEDNWELPAGQSLPN